MHWTKTKIKLLKADYPTANLGELAMKLRTTIPAIKSKAGSLGLHRSKGHHYWTEEDITLMREIYADTPNSKLAEIFHVSINCVENKAHFLGLKKSRQYLTDLGIKNSLNPNTMASRFKKGSVPKNKGMRQTEYMSQKSIDKTKGTRFQIGNKPHNTIPVGTEVVRADGYTYVKTENGIVPKHRLVWMKYNGEIPKGMRVAFIDGDKSNCSPENLHLLSPAQVASRNITSRTRQEREQMWKKAHETRQKTIERDKRRIRWGLPPKTRLVIRYYKYNHTHE